MTKKKYKSIDLFAGIGGIRLGFERAFGDAIDTVFTSEFDEWAAGTYADNFSTPDKSIEGLEPITTAPYIYGDITKIPEDKVPSFDICLAGFPCQAFSIAGNHKGFDDDYYGQTRGTLFRDVVRICEKAKPEVIFCENVKGLTHHRGGNTFKVIKGAFEQIGYVVFDEVLISRNFGVPQNRERRCGFKHYSKPIFPLPVSTKTIPDPRRHSNYGTRAEMRLGVQQSGNKEAELQY